MTDSQARQVETLVPPLTVDVSDMVRRIVARHGGHVVGGYLESTGKVEIRCRHGHVFFATPEFIQTGRFCPTCERSKKRRDNNFRHETCLSLVRNAASIHIPFERYVIKQCQQTYCVFGEGRVLAYCYTNKLSLVRSWDQLFDQVVSGQLLSHHEWKHPPRPYSLDVFHN